MTPKINVTNTDAYLSAEAKVKEALSLSEIGESIFQPQTTGSSKLKVRSRSNSRALPDEGSHQVVTNDVSPVLVAKFKSSSSAVKEKSEKTQLLPEGIPLPHEHLHAA